MTLWSKVLSGFDTEDETVNFGARTVAESYDSVYETTTLATIQADAKVLENPRVSASVQDSALCITIDKSLTIFGDKSCREIKLCIGFDSLISAHFLSDDGYFLFVALSNGIIYCLNLEAEGRLVFSRNVFQSHESRGEIVIKIFSHRTDLMLVTSRGNIYKVSGFSKEIVEAVLDEKDIEKLEEITKDIQCRLLFKDHPTKDVVFAEVDFSHENPSVLMIGADIYVWPSEERCELHCSSFRYTKVRYFKNRRFFLCLRTDGALDIVCCATLLTKKVWDGPISDLVIVEDEVDSATEILVLLKPEQDSATTFLQLISFPDFQVNFNLKVSSSTYLIHSDRGGSIDEIIFFEGSGDPSSPIDTIKVKAVEENSPDIRLQRLLRRCKYQEAEIFAKRYNLSADKIYSAKAASIVKELSQFSANNKDVAEILDELIDSLDKIKNVYRVFEYCHKIVIPNFQQTRRLVSYARERLIKVAEETNDELIAAHLLDLNEILLKIETYEMMRRIRKSFTKSNNDDIDNWIEFSKSDLLNACKNHLTHGEFNVAALIWVRHSLSFSKRVNSGVLHDILQAIPEGKTQADLWPWLFHFVPSILSFYPDGLSEIVKWGYQRAKSFEKFDHENWPESGLEFCQSLMSLLNFKESQSFFHLQEQYASPNSPLQHLTAVIQALSDLLILKNNHKLIVKIDSYMGAPIEVAHLLLHKIYPQKVSDFIQNFLQRYMLNNSLKNDDVLIRYVQKTLNSSEGWWFWQEAPWERKIASVIGCIQNTENRLRQTLETIKKASVPWSPTIVALVDASITVKHPLVSTIITERNAVATKLILKKYGYRHIGITDILIKYIVKQNREEMLLDLYEITKNNDQLKTRALSICINFFLNQGDLERTMSLIKGLTDEDAIYCCKEIINYVGISLRFEEMNNTAAYYKTVLGIVQNKLKSILQSQDDDHLTTASELISLCSLRQEFGIRLSLAEYHTESEIVLVKYLRDLCDELNNERLTSFVVYKKAVRIADLLSVPKILAVCSLIENTRNTDILKYYIDGIGGTGSLPAEECPYVKNLCRIFMSGLKKEESQALSGFKNLSASTLDNCSSGELSQMLLTAVWTDLSCQITTNNSINYLSNGANDTTKWKLYNIYADTDMCCGQMALPFFVDSFKLQTLCTNEELVEENFSTQLIDLAAKARQVSMENYDFSFLQILSALLYSCSSKIAIDNQIISELRTIRDNCLRMILKRIISARTFDLQSGLSCLFTLPEKEAFNWLKSACKMYETNYSRLRAVSDLGYEYCYSIKNQSFLKYFSYYRVCLYWAQRLQNYGIHHKEILSSNTEGKQQILERLMRSEKSGFTKILKEFCTDFEFDFDECYILYLDILLKQWNPTLKIVNLNGRKELKIEEDEITALNKTCKQVAALVEDESAMKKHLAILWSKINFYHYEVFLLIMELLEDKNETRLNHFCFLQNYVRFGKPTQIEYDEWSQLCPENNSLPTISKWRLPFLPKVDQWKLIEPELNLSTYERWMEVADILNLQVHLICTFAVKGSVNQVWESTRELKKNHNNEWLINSKNSALLDDIKTCIKHMPDEDALYYGTAVLYYVVNHTPPGADQAAAAQECYAYAQRWAQASVQSDNVMIEKTKNKYLQLTAKHILHTHGLGDDRYLKLVFSPGQLVRELYADESIVLRSRGATECRPDINSAVNLIGKLFSMNLIQLRLELLEEWLQPSDGDYKFDDSITMNVAAASFNGEDRNIDDDNLIRACYILEWGDKIMSANYLINIGFGATNEAMVRPGIQFRALQVLLSITDSATVQDLTKRDLKSIKQRMKSLRYVSELEKLGLTFSAQRFESSSKSELAQALFRSHSHLPQALVLILQICIDFELKSYNLWDETLTAMAKNCMVKELEKFLPKVSTASHAVGCNGYIKGWEVLIRESFRRCDASLSKNQLDECLTSICSLHSCPVARKLNLKSIVEICFQSFHPELAAALLPFLNKCDTEFVLETIRTSFTIPKVIADLESLSTKQILTISYSIRILEEYSQLDSSKNRAESNGFK